MKTLRLMLISLFFLTLESFAGSWGTYSPKVTKVGDGKFVASAINDTYPGKTVDGETYSTRKEARQAAKDLADKKNDEPDYS